MPIREEIKQGDRSNLRKKKENLTLLAGTHLALGTEIKTLTTKQDKGKVDIKKIINDPEIYELNGKHKETTLPAGDGITEYFVQLQVAESIAVVDDIIGRFRKKLGKKAEVFIQQVEVLHSGALESAYNQGLITANDVKAWTVTKETERLIVKIKEKEKTK